MVREFHLFAGIGGGIYGGQLLGHDCVGACEIGEYQQKVLKQRQEDGWMEQFPIYGDLLKLNGADFKGQFDVLCGGHPCQAWSNCAHGKNIKSKDLWKPMFQFVKDSAAPIVFTENVVKKAIDIDRHDLESIGYKCAQLQLSCADLGACHERRRHWLLAVKDFNSDAWQRLEASVKKSKPIVTHAWKDKPYEEDEASDTKPKLRHLGVGNSQSPYVAACAFRILAYRFMDRLFDGSIIEWNTCKPMKSEINFVLDNTTKNWGELNHKGKVAHTPTTMANYTCPSMMRHSCCRDYKEMFGKATPSTDEWLIGYPKGASKLEHQTMDAYIYWH